MVLQPGLWPDGGGPAETFGVQLTGVCETAVATGVDAVAGSVRLREARTRLAAPAKRPATVRLRCKKSSPIGIDVE